MQLHVITVPGISAIAGALACALLLLLTGRPVAFAQTKTGAPDGQGTEIKKGMLFSSLSFSLLTREAENDQQLFANYLDQRKSSLQVRLDPGYVLRDNLGVGIGLLYGYSSDINTQLSPDGVLSNNKRYERTFALRPYIKNFIPLGGGHRFYIIVPTELQFGYGGEVTESVTENVLTRTFSNTFYYGLEMRPGLLVFVHKQFGFEVNVGAFGLSSSVRRGTASGQPDSKVINHDLNLRINLLQLALGFTAYL